MNIAGAIERGRRLFPERPALSFEGEVFSYRQLDQHGNRMARRLAELGIARGDRVALLLPNSPAFVFGYFGALKLGAVVVAINTALKREEIGFILNDSGARVLLAAPEGPGFAPGGELPHLERVLIAGAETSAAAAAESAVRALSMDSGDPAVILYTSGTTGFPKGAVLTHGSVLGNVRACVEALGLTPEDRVLLCLPVCHCFGQNAALNPSFEAGATLLLHRQFEVEAVRRSIAEQAATVFFGVPTLYGVLYEQADPSELCSVRRFVSAAAELPETLARRWRTRFGRAIRQGYGLTEAGLACFDRAPEARPGSVGTPLPGVVLKVVDGEGREAAPGEPGEIVLQGAGLMAGYWNRPEATAEVLQNGGFHTGDVGRVDAEGRVTLVDRLKDMVNVGGMKVYPSEVEAILAHHPAVAEAAVYGVPDPLLGEQVRAAVVLKPGHHPDAAELLAFCGRSLADFKLPGQIEWVEALPKNATGKRLKRILRERHQAASAPEGSAPAREVPAAAIEDWLRQWIAAKLEKDTAAIALNRPFVDYGMSSVLIVAMIQALGAWLGRSLSPVIAWSFPTLAALARHLVQGEAGTEPAGDAARPALEFWPAVEGFYVYDALLYDRLANDEPRNRRYRTAMERTVPGKVVVEIGPGATAVLSRICVEAGAARVYAVERGEEACRQARAQVEKLGLADKIILIHGDATRVNLPEPADVCVSEIVGGIGGSQGAAVIINQVRHLLKPEGLMIPLRGVTRIAAVSLPEEALRKPVLPPLARHYARKIFEQVGHPFDVRLCVKHFPEDRMISDSAVFEDLDFSRETPTAYEHPIRLNIERPGRFDGFLLWLELHTVEGEIIDILRHCDSWLPIYFPVFDPGVDLAPGDAIEAVCEGRLSDNRLNPDYRIHGRIVQGDGGTLAFDHDSSHHPHRFRRTPFHARLFAHWAEEVSGDTVASPSPGPAGGDAEIAALSDAELFEQLAAEIALARGGKY